MDSTKAMLETSGVEILSGMIKARGEDYSSLQRARRTVGLSNHSLVRDDFRMAKEQFYIARSLGIEIVTLHAGDCGDNDGPERRRFVARAQRLAAIADEFDVELALETGLNLPRAIAEAIASCGASNLFLNYDPINFGLFGTLGDEDALGLLLPLIRHIHIKFDINDIALDMSADCTRWSQVLESLQDDSDPPRVGIEIEDGTIDDRVHIIRSSFST